MSFQVTASFVQEYTDLIEILLQQQGSRFRGTVEEDTHVGEGAKAVDQIGAVTAQDVTDRHGDTPLISTPHDGRWVYPVSSIWADLIDKEDKLRMLINPENKYVKNGVNALNRRIDDHIVNAFFATAKTGKDGSTSTAFDTANQQIAAAAGGLTFAKLQTIREIFLANEVDLDMEPVYMAISAKQHTDLLGLTEVKSRDYNSGMVLEDGVVKRFMGINFIQSERLGVDGSSDRRCPVWVPSGMHLGVWDDLNGSIDKRPDKRNAWQVMLTGSFGATRLEEGKVIEVLCVES